jgi:formylglycine-generating enzyme required for sulfatase activity
MNPDTVNFSNLKERIAARLQGWRRRMGRLSVDSLYLFLAGAALTPAALAYHQGQPAGMELMALLVSVGGNLWANVIQKFRDADDEAAMIHLLEETLAETPALREELDAVLEQLEVFPAAQAGLSPEDREWFARQLRAELEQAGNWSRFQAQIMAVGEGAQALQTGDVGQLVLGDQTVNLLTQEAARAFFAAWTAPEPKALDVQTATSQYLTYLANRYRYLEFKGMGVSDRLPLKLSLLEMYVPLQARTQLPEGDTFAHELRLAGRPVSEEEVEAMGRRVSEPQPVLTLLRDNPGLIILGDPGAGKTTFLKYLAMCLALGQEMGFARPYLPVLAPLSAYADALAEADVSLPDFIIGYYRDLVTGDLPLGALLEEALQQGRAMLLLDGLDEVRDTGQRHKVVERVVQFFSFRQQAGNKFVLTSRIVGYKEVRPVAEGLAECTLVDFGPEEIALFAEKWTGAVERAAQAQEEIAVAAAQREREELLQAVEDNPGVRRLAANPLLLTILALMKRQGVALPERRVQLYEQYVQTLLKHWNLARGLERGATRDLDLVETIRVLAPLALWMHETSPGVGLVKREALKRRLVEIYRERNRPEPERAARRLLADARDYAGLLVERGQGAFGFIHLTFQEYLAAVAIAQKGQKALSPVVAELARRVGDDNWHEVTLLAVGYLGIIQQRDEAADEVLRGLIKARPGKAGLAENWAGEAVLDVWPGGVTRACREEVTETLRAVLGETGRVAPGERVAVGQTLARLGDPRREVTDVDAMSFCYVPPGPFWMGSEEGKDREKPQHWLEMPQGYWLGQYPVTVAQYEAFVADDGYLEERWWPEAAERGYWRSGKGFKGRWEDEFRRGPYPFGEPSNLSNHPIVGVSWYEALAFTRWLTARWQAQGWLPEGEDGRSWRVVLPSEAEWEKAARGGVERPATPLVQRIDAIRPQLIGPPAVERQPHDRAQTPYSWGDALDPNRANYEDTEIGHTNAVGCFAAQENVYGLEEMLGNVFEWTRSKYVPYGEGYAADDGREAIDASDDGRMLRGGSYYTGNEWLRCAARLRRNPPSLRLVFFGFRVCLSPLS